MMPAELMKLVKLGIVICGALGIVGLVTLFEPLFELDKRHTILMLVAFGLPVVMAGLALVKPPTRPWQAGVALAAFALAAWKLQIWTAIQLFADEPTGQKLMVIGAAAGVILAIAAILRPEEI